MVRGAHRPSGSCKWLFVNSDGGGERDAQEVVVEVEHVPKQVPRALAVGNRRQQQQPAFGRGETGAAGAHLLEEEGQGVW